MKANELIERYNAGERNFAGIDLRFANLSQADLSGADLSRANLQGANLQQATLSWVRLYGADLDGANLTDASLYRANLQRAKLNNAKLKRADLRAADLIDAELVGADFSEADLWGVNLPNGFSISAPVQFAQAATSNPNGRLHGLVKHLNPAKLIARGCGKHERNKRRGNTVTSDESAKSVLR